MKILNVAEKPSVARELSKILSPGDPKCIGRHGNGNPIYVFRSKALRNQQDDYVVTSVRGHIKAIEFDARYRTWSSSNLPDLFAAPLVKFVKEDMSDLEKDLRCHARTSNTLILWLDCDREGENIAMEIKEICCDENPNLEVKRARFSSVTRTDIMNAMANLTVIDEKQSEAVEARQELDFRLGVIFTRWQSLSFQEKFGLESILSFGTCQFPTLGFVVDRYREIETFIPRTYWSITVALDTKDFQGLHSGPRDDEHIVKFDWKRERIYDHFTSLMLYRDCTQGETACVEKVHKSPRTRQKPLPLATVELQKRASRYLKLSSEETMKVAEHLYQNGYISYPRTETEIFRSTADLQQKVGMFREHPEYGSFAKSLICQETSSGGNFVWPRKGKHDDEAHPPIHPTKCASPRQLNGSEWKLYDFIVRHFLACCADDAKGNGTNIHIRIGQEEFSTSGLRITDRGYLDIYPYDKWSDKELPDLKEGERFTPSEIILQENETKPPTLLSESDLINLMDKNGIGTDATIAEHIATIQRRQYAEKTLEGRFLPTTLGMALIQGYHNLDIPLGKPYLRAEMEKDCHLISHGHKGRNEVVNECLKNMYSVFLKVVSNAASLETELSRFFRPQVQTREVIKERLSKCGNCNGYLQLTMTGRGKRAGYCGLCSQRHALPSKGNLKAFDFQCPLCNFQILNVEQGQGYEGSGYTLCPSCYSRGVPSGVVPALDSESKHDGSSSMPCFRCPAVELCSLAKGTSQATSIVRCGSNGCSGTLNLKRITSGGYMLGCSEYPRCKHAIFFPKSVKRASLSDSICRNCSRASSNVPRLDLTFSEGALPLDARNPYTACVVCNELPMPVSEDLRDTDHAATLGAIQARENGNITARRSDAPEASAALPTNNAGPVENGLGGRFLQPSRQQTGSFDSNHSSSVPLCQTHQEPCVIRTASSSANSGREFYCCPRPKSSGCGFQQWVDQVGEGSFGRPQIASSSSMNDGSSCYKCHQPGHWAKDCPIQSTHLHSTGGPQDTSPSSISDSSTCYKCQQPGHWAKDCPNQPMSTSATRARARGRGAPGGQPRCGKCKKRGHTSYTCNKK